MASRVVEAQCQSTTQTLQGKLRKAKLRHGVSSKAHAKVVAHKASKEKELEESEGKIRSLRSEAGEALAE
jgi:phage shock protein A